jgi:hypothetical protein
MTYLQGVYLAAKRLCTQAVLRDDGVLVCIWVKTPTHQCVPQYYHIHTYGELYTLV